MFGEQPILNQRNFSGGLINENVSDCLHIAYGVNKSFLFGACISLTSVLTYNADIPLHFHIFSDYVDDDFALRLQKVAEQHNTKITLYLIDNNYFNKFPYTVRYSYAAYYRFLTCEYLQSYTDHVLYLDADIICKGSLRPFLNLDMGDNILAAVRDVDMMQKRAVDVFGFEPDTYFNTGMLYIDLKKWREDNILQSVIETFGNESLAPKLTFPDQDALNLLVKGKVLFMDRHYNNFYNFDDEPKIKNSVRYKEIITDNTVLIHFVGVTKPWFEWAQEYPAVKYFKDIYEASMWRDKPLFEASTLKQLKKKSVHEKYLGKRLDSYKTYLRYTWRKWTKK
ncbi:glycosyltransferase family 8 protein [Citrobacter tructae]|uniref:glycosyltransferase family 8 protein n=1 Tax=Citrobacter tructae TaxID=2562449 RepID=UPI003F579DE8